jgi:hypothetical protein
VTQAKFSEITIDMLRMAQALEHQPGQSGSSPNTLEYTPHHTTHSLHDCTSITPEGPRLDNPLKHLMYCPAMDALLLYIAASSQVHTITQYETKLLPQHAVWLVAAGNGAKRSVACVHLCGGTTCITNWCSSWSPINAYAQRTSHAARNIHHSKSVLRM